MRIEPRHVPPREVMIHFCTIEHEKEKSDEGASPPDYSSMSDEHLEEAVRRFCFRGQEEKPIGVYLVGKGRQQIAEWVLATIPIEELYTRGVDCCWNALLEKNNWNLAAIVNRCGNILCIRDTENLNEVLCVIVAVKRLDPGRYGKFEVIDGFNRAIALIQSGRKEIDSYVGILRDDAMCLLCPGSSSQN